jgi:UPF0755 protein
MMKWLKGLLLLLVAAVAAVGGAGYYALEQLKPVAGSADEVIFTIPAGTSSAGIAELLAEHGLIRNALFFSYYLKYKNVGTGFQAGTYAMTPGMDIQEIIRKLNAGETVRVETVRFTIPEGFTVRQAVKLLVNAGFPEEELLNVISNPERLAGSPGTEALRVYQIPESGLYRFPLEGYLFPETYELPKDIDAVQAVLRMVQELDRKLNALPEGWESQLEENGVTFHELMTIASLVEREVVADNERSLVAGVIYNRLTAGMPLQIDATVQYLFDEQKERLFEKDLQVESPYNTYLNAGLPPGPIASPGLASIKAALYPEASEYLFYVTKKDGTGEHYFGKTYNEHLRNIKKSNAK